MKQRLDGPSKLKQSSSGRASELYMSLTIAFGTKLERRYLLELVFQISVLYKTKGKLVMLKH